MPQDARLVQKVGRLGERNMEVEFAFLADAAQTSSDGKLYALGAGIDKVFTPGFPVAHSHVSLVVKIKVHPTECDRDHQLEIQLWDPDGKLIGPRLSGQFRASRQAEDATRPGFVNLTLDMVNLEFPRAGAYEFHIILNGEHKKTVPLYLVQRAELAPEQPTDAPG